MHHVANPTPQTLADALPAMTNEPFTADEFAELGAILDDLRTRHPDTPTLEFAEGFLAALVCCRRQIAATDYLPVLLALPEAVAATENAFADASQQQRFKALWQRRWQAVTQSLDTPVAALDDPGAYQPEVTDARAIDAERPEGERAASTGAALASFGQVWARGFMAAVAAWPLEWAAPRNKAAATWRNAALDVVERLTLDDLEPPTLSAFGDDDGPPTVSLARMNAFANALWAVYNMREMWRSLGPRIETVHHVATPGRNDPCTCGSGQKYKKCCGKSLLFR